MNFKYGVNNLSQFLEIVTEVERVLQIEVMFHSFKKKNFKQNNTYVGNVCFIIEKSVCVWITLVTRYKVYFNSKEMDIGFLYLVF